MKYRSNPLCRAIALMFAALLLSATPVDAKEKNLVKNGDFSKGEKDWRINYSDGKEEGYTEVADGVLRMRSWPPVEIFYVVLMQHVKVKEGDTYTLSFDAKSEKKKSDDEKPSKFLVAVQQEKPEWQSYGLREMLVLEPDWKTYEFTFTATEIDKKNDPVLRYFLGHVRGDFFIRNVSLVEVKQ